MNDILVLLKTMALLYKESYLKFTIGDSRDLAVEIYKIIKKKNNKNVLGFDGDGLMDLLDHFNYLFKSEDGKLTINKEETLATLKMIFKDDQAIVRQLPEYFTLTNDEEKIKESVVDARRGLRTYIREFELGHILSQSSYAFNQQRESIDDIKSYFANLINKLESLSNTNDVKDPAVMDDIDISSKKSVEDIVKRVKENASSGGKLLTPWQDINDMTQGGIKRGEFVVTSALEHKNKTGFTLSLFLGALLFNEHKTVDPDKTPLFVWISYEDAADTVFGNIYKFLKISETGELPDLETVPMEDVVDYVQSKIEPTGAKLRILRVNPSEWMYKDIQNKIIELESEGCETVCVGNDYLSMLPTTGCDVSGPTGTDIRDLFRRTRNYFYGRNVAFLTPHQLSTDARRLMRNGVPDHRFVKEIVGKGYYSGSTQLGQEIDLELFLHICKIDKTFYQTVHRGKHRGHDVLEPEKMFVMLPFPKRGPIPWDIDRKRIGVREAIEDDEFSF